MAICTTPHFMQWLALTAGTKVQYIIAHPAIQLAFICNHYRPNLQIRSFLRILPT